MNDAIEDLGSHIDFLRSTANKIQHLYIHPDISDTEMTQQSTSLRVAAVINYEYGIDTLSDDELFNIASELFQAMHDEEIARYQESTGFNEQRNNRKTANRKRKSEQIAEGVRNSAYARDYFNEQQWLAVQAYFEPQRREEF